MVAMLHIMQHQFFEYSLRFDQDYAYLWRVVDQVSVADIELLAKS